ncbi:hypothetical protein L484_003913 [Morus notabilis]|uniref:Uncharacterized protein n=1 Tax=Morus notabilis TaxID=981085 RepID=W9RW37_9ROSA|nr:hypothetical protein L484_003913 [Morus notabilis]
MGFDFNIEYKKGGDTIAVDALSRCHEVEPVVGSLSTFSSLVPHWVDAIKKELKANVSMEELRD